jgi:hypothetical protein
MCCKLGKLFRNAQCLKISYPWNPRTCKKITGKKTASTCRKVLIFFFIKLLSRLECILLALARIRAVFSNIWGYFSHGLTALWLVHLSSDHYQWQKSSRGLPRLVNAYDKKGTSPIVFHIPLNKNKKYYKKVSLFVIKRRCHLTFFPQGNF